MVNGVVNKIVNSKIYESVKSGYAKFNTMARYMLMKVEDGKIIDRRKLTPRRDTGYVLTIPSFVEVPESREVKMVYIPAERKIEIYL